MGLPTFAKKFLKEQYNAAFSFDCPFEPTVIVLDMMMFLKFRPPNVTTLEESINYDVDKIITLLNTQNRLRHLIVTVDRKPLPVKRMVAHKKRYEKKDVFPAKGGPYLPQKKSDPIPDPWIQLAGNYKLLQREYYPLLLNALLAVVPRPGQKLVLHGFPGYMETLLYPRALPFTLRTTDKGEAVVPHYWSE